MSDRFVFDHFEVLSTQRQLRRDGTTVALGTRAFDLLLALIERHDRLVTKAELLDVVWPDMVVEEANLPVQVSARFCRNSAMRAKSCARLTPIRKPASGTGSLQTSLCL